MSKRPPRAKTHEANGKGTATPPPADTAELEEHERQLLGKLLLRPELVDTFELSADAFVSKANQAIYAAVLDVRYGGARENASTAVCRALGPRLQEFGGVAYITRLVEQASSIIAHTYEVEQITAAFQRRQARETIDRMNAAMAEGRDPCQVLEETQAALRSIRRMPPGTRVIAGDRGNVGTVVDDHGDSATVHFVSPHGDEATKILPKASLTALSGPASSESAITPQPISELHSHYPHLRPPRIYGLLRQGEVGSIIAAPKVGKTYLVHGLAISAALGHPWIGFNVERGPVALIDNELHPETIAARLHSLASAREVDLGQAHIDVFSLRGRGINLLTLQPTIEAIAGKYSYIILDAWYRLIPPGMDENSNSDMTALFNLLDQYAAMTGATILAVHHTSKGIQGGKSVTDVGAGAGAQSRAVDAHLVIREHEEEGAFVVDAACRSFAPLRPFCMRRNFPLWERADDLDPTQLKQERRGRAKQASRTDDEASEPVEPWTAERFVGAFITDKPRRQAVLEGYAKDAGLSMRQTTLLLNEIRERGLCHYLPGKGRRPAMYARQPINEQQQELVL